MIKGFQEFINEREGRDELADLHRLNRLGVIDDSEYVRSIVDIAKERGIAPGKLLEPGKVAFELGELESDHLSPEIHKAMESFKGPKGETPILVTGYYRRSLPFVEATLSEGSVFRVHFGYYYGPEIPTLSLERDGETYELDQESREQVERVLENHGDWSLYLHDALWMLLDLANTN